MFEYANHGTLSRLIRKYGKLPMELARFYAAEIVNILEYIHYKGVVHRDLKPENILISSDYHIKLVTICSKLTLFVV